ncbi:MAG: ATP-binding cassette domain-containing protein [Chloroflexi bacterium]|nr:ATP-binding cassette domain-containing protein [Chloroflexota bacterium]
MAAIDVAGLSKTYTFHRKAPGLRGSLQSLFRRETLQTRAVDGVTFAIEPGEIVGFLGPNGAGKTTTLKMLSGLLYPSGGQVSVLGHTPFRRDPAFLRQITLVMGQKSLLWHDLPALEMLLLHKEIYDLSDAEFSRNLAELSELLGVAHLLRVQVRKLSLGERMKLELMTALIHRPRVLFLDEPTIGLDVVSQQRVRDFLRQLNREMGTTILLTSHYMDDIQELCPRVLLIDHGRLHFDGPLSTLVEQAAPDKLVTAVYAEPLDEAAIASVEALGQCRRQDTLDPLRLRLRVPRQHVPAVAGHMLRLGRVADLSIEDIPVEEIIRGIFSRSTVGGRSMTSAEGAETVEVVS